MFIVSCKEKEVTLSAFTSLKEQWAEMHRQICASNTWSFDHLITFFIVNDNSNVFLVKNNWHKMGPGGI